MRTIKNHSTIAIKVRKIAGCLLDDAPGATLADRIRYCIDYTAQGTADDLSAAEKAKLVKLLKQFSKQLSK